jgi:hypothetical protein
MTATYTPLLGLALPADGDTGWGTTINNGTTSLIDSAIAGYFDVTMTAADFTLTTTDGASNQARNMMLNIIGSPGAARNVICPAKSKLYFVKNNTTGGFAVTIKTPSGTGVSIPNGKSMVVLCDGTNVREAVDNITNLSYTGTFTGGTGVVNLGSGQLYKDASGNVGIGAAPTAGYKLDVYNASNNLVVIRSASTSSASLELAANNNTPGVGGLNIQQNSANDAYILNLSSGKMVFGTSGLERMQITSNGNVGIGGTPTGSRKLEVYSSGVQMALFDSTTGNIADINWSGGDFLIRPYSAQAGGAALVLHTTPSGGGTTERMRIDSNGQVGIGATPNGLTYGRLLIVSQTGADAAPSILCQSVSTNDDRVYLTNNIKRPAGGFSDAWTYNKTGAGASFYQQVAGSHIWATAAIGTSGAAATLTESMRIDANGNLLVGTASSITSDCKLQAKNTTSAQYVSYIWNATTTGDAQFVGFATEGTATSRGAIDYNRAGGLVRYNTTSDYRAKDIIGPVQDPGATIDALKVYEGVMKGATQSRPMLVAHEAQEHAPYAVSGVKDELNEDGTAKFQQIDVSSLVPLLLAEIQSLRARVAALEV